MTPYQFAGNNPIKYIDLDGNEPFDPVVNFIILWLADSKKDGDNFKSNLSDGTKPIITTDKLMKVGRLEVFKTNTNYLNLLRK